MSSLGYKRCWQCGAENADDRNHCGVCGEELYAKDLIDKLRKEIERLKKVNNV
jgi:uncharacterized membrane protein YvbJ